MVAPPLRLHGRFRPRTTIRLLLSILPRDKGKDKRTRASRQAGRLPSPFPNYRPSPHLHDQLMDNGDLEPSLRSLPILPKNINPQLPFLSHPALFHGWMTELMIPPSALSASPSAETFLQNTHHHSVPLPWPLELILLSIKFPQNKTKPFCRFFH